MSQPASQREDIEGGNVRDHPLDPQPAPTHWQPLQGESNFGDSSGPFFSIYSKAADDEDNKMVERWQKDADGILIFTGLFSAAVAALLAITVQDLRPSSQDTSAFYLGNIYEVFADPNATRASLPVAKPPPFSPPRYAIWVNSLWFLSLVIGLTCALMATSLHQWSRRYLTVAQLARCSPEKRARMRAFFADGMDKMHISWAVEGLPALLHLSVLLFFGGLAIFLFNIDHAVFGSVIWWIGLFSIVYGLITVMPIVRHDSPYYSPLSRSAWFLYAGMNYVLLKLRRSSANDFSVRLWFLKVRYLGWMLGGVEKAADETVSGQSSEIDIRIFDWTIRVLGEDESLEKFFEAIPGLLTSKLVDLEREFPWGLFETFWFALDGFMDRTLSSNSITESTKSRRVVICRDIMSMMPSPSPGRYHKLNSYFDQAPISVERLEVMARWLTNKTAYVVKCARAGVARHLVRMQERDDNWILFASDVCGLAAQDLRDNIAHAGDNLLLSTMINVSRRTTHFYEYRLVKPLTHFDILHTLPGLQHDFCTLWNEIVQEAENQGDYNGTTANPVEILREIRFLYIALHQGTDAAPTAFSIFSDPFDSILFRPSSYPLCDIASHRPDPTAHLDIAHSYTDSTSTQPDDSSDTSPYPPSHFDRTIPQETEQANTTIGLPSPSDKTPPGEIRDSSRLSAAAEPVLPVHTSSRPTDASPSGAVAAALKDISTDDMLQRDIVASCAERDADETLSAASASCGARSASTPNPFPPVPSVPILASPTLSRVPPFPKPNSLASASSASEVAATSFVCSDDPAPQMHTRESGETSHARVAPPLILLHPDSAPATITPSAGPDPSGDHGGLQSTTSSAYLPHPLEGSQQRDPVALCAAPNISEIPSMVNLIPQSVLPVSPTITISDFPSPPILPPALSGGMTTAEPPSFVEPAPLQPDHIPHVLRFSSSSFTTASSDVSPQATFSPDLQVTLSIGTSSSHDDTRA